MVTVQILVSVLFFVVFSSASDGFVKSGQTDFLVVCGCPDVLSGEEAETAVSDVTAEDEAEVDACEVITAVVPVVDEADGSDACVEACVVTGRVVVVSEAATEAVVSV